MNETYSRTAVLPGLRPDEMLSLRTNFSWTVTGNVTHAGCQWAALVLLAKLGTPEMLGQYSLGLAICLPILGFSSLQLRNVVTTDISKRTPFPEYLSFRLLTTIVAMAIILLLPLVLNYGRKV